MTSIDHQLVRFTADDQPDPDVWLLYATLRHIENHPEQWRQDRWRSGSAGCYAFHAAVTIAGSVPHGGGVPLVLADHLGEAPMMIMPDGATYVPIWHRARRLLGIDGFEADMLFKAANALDDLRNCVRRICSRVHYVTIEAIKNEDRERLKVLFGSDDDPPGVLAVVEHRPDVPTLYHGTDNWIPLRDMREHARKVADIVGARYVEPTDTLAIELLGSPPW